MDLLIGLPPAHFGAQYREFETYFKRGMVRFQLGDKPVSVYFNSVTAYPQAYAAAMTVFSQLRPLSKCAVLSYCGKSVPAPVSVPPPELTAIEQAVRKVLQENPVQILAPLAAPQDGTKPAPSKGVLPGENPPQETELPEDVLGTISDMIDVFRSPAF